LYVLQDELFVTNFVRASSISLLIDHVPEIGISSSTCRDETHIIFPPVNGSDFLSVTHIFLMLRAFSGVEVINMNGIVKICSSEHVSSITELNFSATFDLDTFGGSQLLRKNIVDNKLIWNTNDHMETTWMESYS
jgi:hypothetical protein